MFRSWRTSASAASAKPTPVAPRNLARPQPTSSTLRPSQSWPISAVFIRRSLVDRFHALEHSFVAEALHAMLPRGGAKSFLERSVADEGPQGSRQGADVLGLHDQGGLLVDGELGHAA